jgi:hypothetical protein
MTAIKRQYLFGLFFVGVALYQLTKPDYLEVLLYVFAGSTFIVNGLTLEPRLAPYKKPLVILSWVLIITTGLLLLYLAQFKWF